MVQLVSLEVDLVSHVCPAKIIHAQLVRDKNVFLKKKQFIQFYKENIKKFLGLNLYCPTSGSIVCSCNSSKLTVLQINIPEDPDFSTGVRFIFKCKYPSI